MNVFDQLTALLIAAFTEHQQKVREGMKVELASELLNARILKLVETALSGEVTQVAKAVRGVAHGLADNAGKVAAAVGDEVQHSPMAMLFLAEDLKMALKALKDEGAELERWASNPDFHSRMDVPWKRSLVERVSPQVIAERLVEACFTAISVQAECKRVLQRMSGGARECDTSGTFVMERAHSGRTTPADPSDAPTLSSMSREVAPGSVAGHLPQGSLILKRDRPYRSDHAKIVHICDDVTQLAGHIKEVAGRHYEKIERSGTGGLAYNPHTIRSVASTICTVVVADILCTCAMLVCVAAEPTGHFSR